MIIVARISLSLQTNLLLFRTLQNLGRLEIKKYELLLQIVKKFNEKQIPCVRKRRK